MNVKRFVAACLVAVVSLAASGVAFAAEKAPSGKINLNTASAEQLSALPGVGPKLAARIVEHRQKEGSFKSAQELRNVKGSGENNFRKLQTYLTVGEASRPAASR